MVILVHVANLLYLLAYLVKDILWLRVVTCLAGMILLANLFLQPERPWIGIGWNLVFVAINLVHVNILLHERRPVRLGADEARLHQLVFRTLRPRELQRLLAVGDLRDHVEGEVLVRRGEALDRLMVIVSGRAQVRLDDQAVAELGPGRFVGEMSFLTGEAPGADVRAAAPVRVAAWRSDELKRFLEQNPDVRATVQLVIGTDLVAKLRRPAGAPAAAAG